LKKARPKTLIYTAYSCGVGWVNDAMAKKCHLSEGQALRKQSADQKPLWVFEGSPQGFDFIYTLV